MKIIVKFYAKSQISHQDIKLGIDLIEKAVNENLKYTIHNGKPLRINSLLEFLSPMQKKVASGRNIPLITNALEDKMIVFSGNYISYPIADMWYLLLQLTKNIEACKINLLFHNLTQTLDSYWAKVTPSLPEGRLTRQSFSRYEPSNDDLPKLPHIEVYDSPYIPAKLGWINYWPGPTLQRIDFKQEHRALFHSVQNAANDGLILQITEEPLDFEITEHLRKTVAIYDALPAIGGRDCV